MGRAEIDGLYRDTGHLVLRRCLRVLHDPEEAMDATQWTYLRAIETGFDVRSRGEALVWLYRTATRRCLHVLRNGARRSRLLTTFAGDLAGVPVPLEVDVVSRDLVARALAQIDETTGEIALLTWGMGLTNERAAEACGVSPRTVGRARVSFEAALRALMNEGEG